MFFEIYVDLPERAIAFYEALLGWRFETESADRWLVLECRGQEHVPIGELVRRTGILLGSARLQTHVNAFVLRWEVPSLDRALQTAARMGGITALGHTELANGDRLARIVDSEGNRLALLERVARH